MSTDLIPTAVPKIKGQEFKTVVHDEHHAGQLAPEPEKPQPMRSRPSEREMKRIRLAGVTYVLARTPKRLGYILECRDTMKMTWPELAKEMRTTPQKVREDYKRAAKLVSDLTAEFKRKLFSGKISYK